MFCFSSSFNIYFIVLVLSSWVLDMIGILAFHSSVGIISVYCVEAPHVNKCLIANKLRQDQKVGHLAGREEHWEIGRQEDSEEVGHEGEER